MISDASLLDDRLAIVGGSGSGKTYAAGVLTERLLGLKQRVIVIDPLGVWYGLRLCPDGKTPSPFQPVIFGGRHGDMTLTEQSGQVIGEAVAGAAQNCIIDLSQFGTKASERRFMLAFLTQLYRKTEASPVHLIFDEADMFAPQVLLDRDGDAARLLDMMETIVRRGRVKGFTPWLITQRPAVLSKNVLSQADGVIAFKLTSTQDRDAIGAWVEGQADKAQWKQLYGQLATLPRGRGLVWVPGRDLLDLHAFPAKTTFDSSRTPKRGETVSAVSLRAIDLGALKEKVKTVEEEAKANDPKALRAEIARLKGDIQKLSGATANGFTQADLDAKWKDGFEMGSGHGYNQGARDVRDGLSAAIADALNAFHPPQKPAIQVPQPPKAPARSEGRPVEARGSAPHKAPLAAGDRFYRTAEVKLPIGEKLVLVAAAQFSGVEREELTVLTGYKRSSRDAYIQRLREKGLIEVEGQTVRPTRAGIEALPHDYEPLPTGQALQAYWLNRLPEGEKRILEALIASYPDAMPRADLDGITGYKRSSRDAYIQRMKSKRLVTTAGSSIAASDTLFDGAR